MGTQSSQGANRRLGTAFCRDFPSERGHRNMKSRASAAKHTLASNGTRRTFGILLGNEWSANTRRCQTLTGLRVLARSGWREPFLPAAGRDTREERLHIAGLTSITGNIARGVSSRSLLRSPWFFLTAVSAILRCPQADHGR